MGNFGRDNRSGGRDFNSRPSFGGRGSDRPEMHKATCASCGKECEVPFRPTGSKPVYCSDCFKNNGGSDTRRSDDRGFGRPRNDDRPMFDAVCANCAKNCKVPFQPGEGRQVLCIDCFQDKGGDPRRANNISRNSQVSYKEEFEALNAKLDQLLQMINANTPSVDKKTTKPLKTKEVDLSNEEIVAVAPDAKVEKAKVTKKPRTKKA